MQRQEIVRSDQTEARESWRSTLAPLLPCAEGCSQEHFVQFYEQDAFLIDSVVGFMAAGLRNGEAGIFIGTPEHRKAFEEQLRNLRFDLGALQACGQYTALDAAETLSKFMRDGVPQKGLFFEVVG